MEGHKREQKGTKGHRKIPCTGVYRINNPELYFLIQKLVSSSTSQGTSIWLTAEPTPTATPTPTPTVTETPDVPQVKPVASETQAGKSPVPLAGVLAGLGVAGVLFGLRMRK